jgi:1-pyrroline-5-carboxylate dehydrogenase
MLLDVARALRVRKFELGAWLVVEAGKTWPEAEGETAEAIDYCEYYEREMAPLRAILPSLSAGGFAIAPIRR